MLTYHYTARNAATGEKVKADVQAQSQTEAVKAYPQRRSDAS